MMVAMTAIVASGLLAGAPQMQNALVTPRNAKAVTLELCVRDGYEIGAIQSATTRGCGFVVMMRQTACVCTGLNRISRGPDDRSVRESDCI